MVEQNPVRKIKVEIRSPESQVEPKPEYIYHWDRIFGALAVLILLTGLIGYGLYAWLKPTRQPVSVQVEEVEGREGIAAKAAKEPDRAAQEPVPSPSIPSPGIAAANPQTGADSPATIKEFSGTGSDPAQSPMQREPVFEEPSQRRAREAAEVELPRRPKAEEPPAEIAEPAPHQTPFADSPPMRELDAETIGGPTSAQPTLGEETAEPTPSRTPIADPPLAQELDPKTIEGTAVVQAPPGEQPAELASMPTPVREEITEAAPAQTPVSESGEDERQSKGQEQIGEAVTAVDTPEDDTGNGTFSSQKISISSPAVKRFVLAQSVTGNEPKGSLGDISMDADGVAAVCSFSEVIGLAGEVLEYRWFHDGKQVLRIRVPVGAKHWRSHAQKAIYKRMTGAWRVELRDSADQLLASADFVF